MIARCPNKHEFIIAGAAKGHSFKCPYCKLFYPRKQITCVECWCRDRFLGFIHPKNAKHYK